MSQRRARLRRAPTPPLPCACESHRQLEVMKFGFLARSARPHRKAKPTPHHLANDFFSGFPWRIGVHRATSDELTMARIAALSGAGSFAQAVTTCDKSGPKTTGICESLCESPSQCPCKIWRREGDSNPTVLPVNKGESHGDSRIDSRNSIPSCPDLTQVVTAWAKLSAPIKAAILALVRTAS